MFVVVMAPSAHFLAGLSPLTNSHHTFLEFSKAHKAGELREQAAFLGFKTLC